MAATEKSEKSSVSFSNYDIEVDQEDFPRPIKGPRLFFSYRGFILFLLFLGSFLCNGCYFVLNFSMVCMINATYLDSSTATINGSCSSGSSDSSGSGGTLDWSKNVQDALFAGEAIGSIWFIFISGWLLDKYGAHKLFAGANVLLSASTLVIPFVTGFGPVPAIVARIIQGIGMLWCWPVIFVVASTWFPVSETGLVLSFATVGFYVGGIVSQMISGVFCEPSIGWSYSFYLFGIVAGAFVILWFVFYTDSVENCRWLSQREREYIMATRSNNSTEEVSLKSVPWKKMLTSIPVWALIAVNFTDGYAFYYLSDYMPTYLDVVLGVHDTTKNGLYSSLPYICVCFSCLACGYLSDWAETKQSATLTVKAFTGTMGISVSIALVAISFFGCDMTQFAVASFASVYFFYGIGIGGYIKAISYLAPKYTGCIAGLTTTANYLGGIVAPYLTGSLTQPGTLNQWHTTIYVTSVVVLAGSLIFVFFGSGEDQKWEEEHSQAEPLPMKTDKMTPPASPAIQEIPMHPHKQLARRRSNSTCKTGSGTRTTTKF